MALFDSSKVERYIRVLSEKAKLLRTFQLCARKWGNDHDEASLAGLLVRIEDVASEIEQANHQGWDRKSLDDFLDDAEGRFDSLKQEIDQWYIKFSDCSGQPSSCSQQDMSCDEIEIVELIDSLLDTRDFTFQERGLDADLKCLLDSLLDKMIFFKNFVRFISLQVGSIISIADDDGRRHFGNLLTHIRAMAITAAYCLFMSQYQTQRRSTGFVRVNLNMLFKVTGLLRRIKPVDPQVYENCIQTLNASKLSRQPHTTATLEENVNVLNDFITSLLSHLFEILLAGTIPVFSTKDQLQILHDELRSLKFILENQPKNFDDNMWDLTGAVACDAGCVIFSLFLDSIEYGLAKEMNHMLFDLLERIKLITAKDERKSPQGSIFNFANVDELRFVDFLLQNLAEFTNPEASSAAIPKLQIQTIYEGLVFLRPFLGKILELHDQKEELQALWTSVLELAYKVEFLVDSLAIRDTADSSVMSCDSFDSIVEEIKIIKLDASKIFDVEETKGVERCDDFYLERSMPRTKDKIVGFEEEATSIKERLKHSEKQLQILAIVGMPGSGKTTLAKMVYNDSSIISHFHVLAWCCVSQVCNKKKLLLEILTCIIHELPAEYSEKSEPDLALEVYQGLKRKRYLIVLDDVWEIDAWNELEALFPTDANGSRIILTSRCVFFNPKDKFHWETHALRQLTDDESLELLETKLFLKAGWPPALCELRKPILEKCKGLPLTIIILAGILATVEQNGWKEVVEHLNSGIISVVEKCKDMLELSYRYLPDNLKPCLLYFGVFPEDQELTTKKLTWLWIAEGFVSKMQSKSLEDEAKDYLRHLIRRSLVMVDKRSSTGEVKTCRVHDLLHEFCVEKAKEERFVQFLQGYNELSNFGEAHNVRRLCIYSINLDNLKNLRMFCPRLRSLLFINEEWSRENCSDPFIGISKAVRVLVLSQFDSVCKYPVEMELLVQLRYLSIGRCTFGPIPSSIANLVNLETLIVYKYSIMRLPNSIWNLKKLRHLKIEGDPRAQFYLDDHHIGNSAQLCNLDTISSIYFYLKNAEKILKKFPNIRKLKARIYSGESDEENGNVLVLDCFTRLESLNLSSYSTLQVEFSCLSNLKKLTLSDVDFPWSKMSSIGNLSNLEVLKLCESSFVGEIWNMEAEQFPSLKFLKLMCLDIVKWTATKPVKDHFRCLMTLVVDRCRHLEELPSCLGDLYSLEMIEISDCSESLVISVQQIEEEQMSMGNEDLKVLIHS